MTATIIEALGIVLVAAGLGFIYPPLFPIALGVGLVLFGLAIERGK